MPERNRPLIIKRVVEEGGHGHHGGAWKVAYADFVTAMMAFFLLLWLLSTSSEQTLKGLAEYFSDATIDTGPPGGLGGALHGLTVMPQPARMPSSPLNLQPTVPFREQPDSNEEAVEINLADGADGAAYEQAEAMTDARFEAEKERRERERFAEAKAAILNALQGSPELARLEDNLIVDQTPEGLRIQIVDRDQNAMFPSGSDAMYPHTRKLLEVVVRAIADLPNKLSIRGHTDARPFAAGAAYDNWRLSSDRGNATRRAMQDLGLPASRLAEVVGKGDAEPLFADDPHDPRNRRISLVLLNAEAPAKAPPAAPTRPPVAGTPAARTDERRGAVPLRP